ncbi:MAG: DUF2267 domain-containing protein [Halobacterium sp.]
MHYDTFVGEVQHRLELGTEGEAVRATRVVLEAFGQRLGEGEASDLAANLPMEIDRYLTEADSGQQFSYQAFLERVAEGANVDETDAQFYAQAVFELVDECAQANETEQVQAQLPDDFDPLFEFVDSESTPW